MAKKEIVFESSVEKGREMATYSIPTEGGRSRTGTGAPPPEMFHNKGCGAMIAAVIAVGICLICLIVVATTASFGH